MTTGASSAYGHEQGRLVDPSAPFVEGARFDGGSAAAARGASGHRDVQEGQQGVAGQPGRQQRQDGPLELGLR